MLLSKNEGGVRRWIDDILGVATLVGMVVALWLILIYTPVELVQGASQKVFYVHLASVWNAYLSFFFRLCGECSLPPAGEPRQGQVCTCLGGGWRGVHLDHADQRSNMG